MAQGAGLTPLSPGSEGVAALPRMGRPDAGEAWRWLQGALGSARRSALLRDGGAVLLLALVTLVAFWDTVAHGRVAYENDTRIFYYPLFVRLGEAIKAGQLPLWSSQLFGGYPIFADGEAGSLYPPHLLSLLLLPLDTAFLLLRPLRFFQAALFTYLFCRCVGLGRFGAVVGALCFAFGGFAFAQMHHTNISTAAVWLPLTLAFGELAVRYNGRQRWAFAILAGVAFGMQGLIIHVQVVLMSALAFAAYVGFRVATGPSPAPVGPAGRAGPASRVRGRTVEGLQRLGLAAGIVGVAGLTGGTLAAVQLLPLYELGTFSFRGEGVDYAYASQYSLPPIQLLSMLLPDFFVVNGQYWGLWSRWEVFAYVGIAPLLLALYGVVLARSRLVFFFVGLGLFSLAVALGEHSPGGLHRALSGLPGFSVLRAPGRFLFLFTLSVAVLAAFGADALRRELGPRRRPGTVRQVTLSALLAVGQLAAMAAPLAVALVAVYVETHKTETVAWLQTHLLRLRGFDARWATEQVYRFVLAAVDVTQPATLRQLVLLLAATGLLLLWDRFRVLGRLWQVLLVLLIAVDLIGLGARFHPTVGVAELRAPSGVATFLAQHPGLYRVYSHKGSRDEPNRLLGFPVAEANGYSSLEPDRHQAYTSRLEYAPNRLLDLLNVRFLAVKNEFLAAPSFNLTSYDPRRPLLSSTGRNPAGYGDFRLDDVPADSLRVVSTLRWSSTLAQGTPVARLTATDTAGKTYVFQMLAGVHTAEWAWERPDLQGKMPHQLPPIARTWQQRDGNAPPYPAHYYYAEFPLGATVRLRRVEVQFLHPTSQVELFGLAAFSDVSKDLEQLEPSKLGKLRRVYADDEVVLYENADYLPRAFLVPSAVVERPGDEILHRLALGDFSPERMVILEEQFDVSRLGPPPPPGQAPPVRFNGPQGTEVASGPGTVSLQEVQEDALRLRVNAQQSAMLFLADLAYPGWKAYVDGQETPIYRANYLFRSVFVPTGQHTVEFVYRPRSFRLGLLLTLVGTVAVTGALLGLTLGPLRLRRPVWSSTPAGPAGPAGAAPGGFPRPWGRGTIGFPGPAPESVSADREATAAEDTRVPDQRRTKGGASDA
jgi:hypothetical protein